MPVVHKCNFQLHSHGQTGVGCSTKKLLSGGRTRQRIERRQGARNWRGRVVAAAGIHDRTMLVKLSLAKTSGSLDLSWMGLDQVPEEIFELPDLEVLTLAGNSLKSLPPQIAKFKSLKRLQAAGNQIVGLPPEITELVDLEDIWLHGNLLEQLPGNIGGLEKLRLLSLAGNRLSHLPPSLERLTDLRELNLAGNLLESVPPFIGKFEKLESLSLNGNRLKSLPREIGKCTALQFLNLQTNNLAELPAEVVRLKAVVELNISDNQIQAVPESWEGLEACKLVWMYGNRLKTLPRKLFTLPNLECIWAEGNPLAPEPLLQNLEEAPPRSSRLREIGLDYSQIGDMHMTQQGGVWSRVRVGEVPSDCRGYFKLRKAGNGGKDDPASNVLVVTFASAPGTPNWGGVLNRISAEASEEEKQFDVLYVCDGGRNWYSAGDDGLRFWREQLRRVTERYSRVVMLGDSMGATAALLFSDLATSVQAFTPQVDLSEASLRPGQPREWLGSVRQRILEAVNASQALIECHVGTWEHDLDQAKLLPAEKCELVVYHIDSHRLAHALNSQRKLVPAVRAAILKELGLYKAPRLANLL